MPSPKLILTVIDLYNFTSTHVLRNLSASLLHYTFPPFVSLLNLAQYREKVKYLRGTMLTSLPRTRTRWAGKEKYTCESEAVKTKPCIQSISGQFDCCAKANRTHSKLMRSPVHFGEGKGGETVFLSFSQKYIYIHYISELLWFFSESIKQYRIVQNLIYQTFLQLLVRTGNFSTLFHCPLFLIRSKPIQKSWISLCLLFPSLILTSSSPEVTTIMNFVWMLPNFHIDICMWLLHNTVLSVF